jgi:hypothetical protein
MLAFFATSGLGADVRMLARSPAAASPSFFTACVVAMPKSPNNLRPAHSEK